MTTLSLNINGIDVVTDYPEKDIREVYLPLLRRLTDMQREKSRRIIVFLAAPPGCGKSTLGLFLQLLSEQTPDITPLQVLGIDGFHHYSSYLKKIIIDDSGQTLLSKKGAPETFDIESLIHRLSSLQSGDVWWPLYSRKLHEPVDNQIHVTADIVLIEGNYLLYTLGGWRQLEAMCDYSLFMTNSYEVLKQRLIERKEKGGSDHQDAVEHFYKVDGPNINTVLKNRREADLELTLDNNNAIISWKETA